MDRLVSVLDRWQARGRIAHFWLRDDDAVAPTPALSRLLDLSSRHRVPVTLAVIPAEAGSSLAGFLAGRPAVDVALHGWSHQNHASPGEKKQELGRHRAHGAMLEELSEGAVKLKALFGDQFLPMLVPPWNRIDTGLLPHLGEAGIETLSVFGPEKPAPVRMVNTHADIMDWHGTRGCRAAGDIVTDVIARLAAMEARGGVMGLLTHHLVHDEAAWIFLDAFFAATARHPACRWATLADLTGGQGDPAQAPASSRS
ncbi:MAG: polysaccharide deacetylase family protein [Rhizobiaceae bacterium]|nr:polysaccharide deacetylase family protein [Rhizobiaceae bacterium]